MNESTDPLACVARAKEDYTLLRYCVHRREPLTYRACFHGQQFAEKYLKAMRRFARRFLGLKQ